METRESESKQLSDAALKAQPPPPIVPQTTGDAYDVVPDRVIILFYLFFFKKKNINSFIHFSYLQIIIIK